MKRLLALIIAWTLTFTQAEEATPNLENEVKLESANGQSINALIFEVNATTVTFLNLTQMKAYTVNLETLTPETRALCTKFRPVEFRGIKLGTTIAQFEKTAISIGANTAQMSKKDKIAAYSLTFKHKPDNMLAGTDNTSAHASEFLFSFCDSRLVTIMVLRGNNQDKKPEGESESMAQITGSDSLKRAWRHYTALQQSPKHTQMILPAGKNHFASE